MVPNEEIGLDEEELRRLLEQPISSDETDGLAEGGAVDPGDGAEELPDSASTAGRFAAGGPQFDAGGAATAGSLATLAQDSIDQLLAKARGEPQTTSVSSSPPRQAEGSGAAPASVRQAARGEALRPPAGSAAAESRAPVTVQPVQFSPLGAPRSARERSVLNDLGILLDVPLHITVELGRADMPVRDILALGPGSVIELDRSAGEVLDVLVNGTLIAQGEVVVVDEQFGIRLTRVLSPNRDMLEGIGVD